MMVFGGPQRIRERFVDDDHRQLDVVLLVLPLPSLEIPQCVLDWTRFAFYTIIDNCSFPPLTCLLFVDALLVQLGEPHGARAEAARVRGQVVEVVGAVQQPPLAHAGGDGRVGHADHGPAARERPHARDVQVQAGNHFHALVHILLCIRVAVDDLEYLFLILDAELQDVADDLHVLGPPRPQSHQRARHHHLLQALVVLDVPGVQAVPPHGAQGGPREPHRHQVRGAVPVVLELVVVLGQPPEELLARVQPRPLVRVLGDKGPGRRLVFGLQEVHVAARALEVLRVQRLVPLHPGGLVDVAPAGPGPGQVVVQVRQARVGELARRVLCNYAVPLW
mmetsp:Transcript_11806/g.18147  ORF Transcript_11806/g.18147 Transcript_11806/m.18147 type:complete len:335 (+) Transcript_11806:252-1256(+)